jgi:hypothetical protein
MITPELFVLLLEQRHTTAGLREYIDSRLKIGQLYVSIEGWPMEAVNEVSCEYSQIGWDVTFVGKGLSFSYTTAGVARRLTQWRPE